MWRNGDIVFLRFRLVHCPEGVIPDSTGHAEVHTGSSVVNEVMRAQPAKSETLEIEMMKNVMNDTVDNKARQQASLETQQEVNLMQVTEDKPDRAKQSSHHEPGHRNRGFRCLVVYFVTGVGRRPAFVINHAMEPVFKQAPTEEADAKTDDH